MSQVLHILGKDVRQLRWEIAAFVAVLAVYAAMEPRTWGARQGVSSGLPSLMFYLALAILTIRVVQTERLAGLNQFWTTRPYEWPKLFAAKASFLMLTAYLPLVVSQMYLLWRAHLPVAASLPALLLNLLLLTAIAVGPMACIGALTRSFAQAAVVAVLVVVAYALTANLTFFSQSLAPAQLLGWQTAAWGGLLAIALLMQYSRRRTMRSLATIGLAAVVVLVMQVACVGTPLAVAGYVPAGEDAPVELQFEEGSHYSSRQNGVSIFDPMVRTVRATVGKRFVSNATRVTLSNASGYRWQAPWTKADWTFSQAGPDTFNTSHGMQGFDGLVLPRKVIERLGDGPVSLRMEFAVDELEDEPFQRLTVSAEGERVAKLSYCVQGVNSLGPPNSWSLNCRTAFRRRLFSVDTFVPTLPCGDPRSADTAQHFRTEVGTIEDWPIAPKISPVAEWESYSSSDPRTWAPCPGTPITFSRIRVVRRMLIDVPEKTIRLKDFVDTNR